MGDPADYDDWADETPDHAARLTQLVTELAEHLGLNVGPAEAPEPRQPVAYVEATCSNCFAPLGAVVLGLPSLTTQLPVRHLCKASAMNGTALVSFTLAVRSGT